MSIKLIIIGIVLGLGFLWGGSYVAGTLPDHHWALFPTIMTTAF